MGTVHDHALEDSYAEEFPRVGVGRGDHVALVLNGALARTKTLYRAGRETPAADAPDAEHRPPDFSADRFQPQEA